MSTLLQAVQTCLQYSGSFEVDSIFDTDESERTAIFAREVYYRIAGKLRDAQFDSYVGTLDGVGDTAAPNYLRIPDGVRSVQFSRVQYSKDEYPELDMQDVEYLSHQDFLDVVRVNRTSEDDTLKVQDPSSGAEYVIRTDTQPRYCTSFDGELIAFDSYDKEVDTTLHEQKSLIVANREKQFYLEDSFEIPLPSHLMQGFQDTLLNEYYEVIIEEAKPTVARRARVFEAKMQQDHQRIGGIQKPTVRYGRR